jgi:hypothetical protein
MSRELLLACSLLQATALAADGPKGLVLSALADSPGGFVAPVVLLSWPDSKNGDLLLSQWGWTTAADWERALTPDWKALAGAELTPWHAHASNLNYNQGERAPALDFTDTAAEIRFGLRRQLGPVLTSDASLLLNKEWLQSGTQPSEMWRSVHVGLELRESLAIVRSEDPYRFRFDGWRLSATLRAYGGDVLWWRGALSAISGRKLGPLFLRASVAGLRSSSGNPVGQWLVGGSWDALGATALYGHPYAEYRVSTAAVANGGADLRLIGDWEVGLRGGVLLGPGGSHHGQYAQVSTILSGLLFYAGIGFRDSVFTRPALYAGAAGAWALP